MSNEMNIAEPSNLLPSDKWRATLTHKTNTVTGKEIKETKYTITHADGSATIRTLWTDEDGTVTSEDKKLAKAPEDAGSSSRKKPIGPPVDLPEGARWTAKRQILTDEATSNVTVTIVYRIKRLDGKQYTQKEECVNNGPVSVAKGALENGDDEDTVAREASKASPATPQTAPQLEDTERDPSVGTTVQNDEAVSEKEEAAAPNFSVPIEPSLKKDTTKKETPVVSAPPLPPPSKPPTSLPETTAAKDISGLPKSPGGGSIGPPRNLPEGAGWKARRETVVDGTGRKTITATYQITSAGTQWTQTEVTQPDGTVKISTTEKVPAQKSALGKPIPPPTSLPEGAGWKARRESFTADSGSLTIVTTYDIMHDGHLYQQTETRLGDADAEPTSIEKTDKKPAPPDALSPRSKKPIQKPQDLPEGAGWKASRKTVLDERGIATTTTNYTITIRNPVSYVLSEYEQTETQVDDDGPITITHKSNPKQVGY